MAGKAPIRRLTTIVAADVAGYSRLTAADEEATLAALRAHRIEFIDPKIAEHRGRIANTAGDSLLMEFPSVVEALRCAIELQRGMRERNAEVADRRRIEFRIGINLGDVVEQDGDLLGDGVNVAARLEQLCDRGGVCMSDDVMRQVQGKLAENFRDGGLCALKNISPPIHVWHWSIDDTTPADPGTVEPALALPEKPSIAVLPFQIIGGDPEQEYFADGIVEDVITALSRMRWLFVIARNSSFTYRGRTVDVKQIGRELGARYLLEGSVRRAANRVRITGQLIDSLTGAHLWADRFEGGLEDLFDLQDRITESVVGAIGPRLEKAEIERAKRKPTENLDAYDYYLRGMASFYQQTKPSNREALDLLYKAIELDPEFAPAHGMAAYCYVLRKVNGWTTDSADEIAEAIRLARKAVQVGDDDANALARGGYALAYMAGDLDGGVAFIDRALLLDPNLAIAWLLSGWLNAYRGELDAAIEYHTRAMRLSPFDPNLHHMENGIGFAHFLAGRYDDAATWAARASHRAPNYLGAAAVTAASHALAGRTIEASNAMERVRRIDPDLRISNLKDWFPIRQPEHQARYAKALKMAGLPE